MIRKQDHTWYPIVLLVTDLCGSCVAFLAAYWFRFDSGLLPVTKGYFPHHYLRLLPAALAIWIVSLNFVHLYRTKQRIFSFEAFIRIVKGSLLAITILIAILFFIREGEKFSRPLFPITVLSSILFLTLFRAALERVLLKFAFKKGIGTSRALIVGTGPLGQTVAQKIIQHPEYGFSFCGFIAADPDDVGGEIAEGKVIGTLADLRTLVKELNIDEVLITQPNLPHDRVFNIIQDCEREITEFRMVPDLLELVASELSVEDIGGIAFFSIKETPLRGWNLVLKRAFDIIVSAVLLVALAPLFAIMAMFIKRDSRGPIIYKQDRLGYDGRLFTIYKFRSMHEEAEKDSGPVWAKPNDPRATRTGAILRRYNMDELPQLVNVLKGDMSLVGPRPERPYFVERFKDKVPRYMSRHKVKSGITGWAQVNGLRGSSSIVQRVKYDLYYVENWSLWLDMKILLMTLFSFKNPSGEIPPK
jgi:exopolysaccharide biosynthesis polyprenyl glycosylphosphotransferase